MVNNKLKMAKENNKMKIIKYKKRD